MIFLILDFNNFQQNSMNSYIPTFEDLCIAHKRIEKYINRTPVLTSTFFNSLVDGELYFKCENFQKVGAFKFRGAINTVLSLSKDEIKKGLATHSSGNHAQALALAAKIMNTDAYIVMPENSPEIKKNAVAEYGAKITYCTPTLQAREDNLNKIVEETGATFIHPYDDSRIIAGQGTSAKELIEDIPNLDYIIAPVGGGGLLSGTSISTKAMSKAKVIAAEPKGADDAYRSFKNKKLIPSINPNTIADGLLTSLSDLTFEIILKNVDDIITVDEDEIIKAMKLVWERMKIIIEPSSAVAVAGVLNNAVFFKNKKVGIIISGGNVDFQKSYF